MAWQPAVSSVSSRREATLKVRVQMLGGAQTEVVLCQGWTVHDLKRKIEERLRVPAAQQRLLFGHQVLLDDGLDASVLSALPATNDRAADPPLELMLLIRSSAVVEMLKAVRQFPWALATAPEEMRGDKEVVMEAVKHHGMALQYATDELRGDKDVVREALRQKGWALQYAANKLQCDKDVVLEAVRQNGLALQYAADELRNDKEVVMEALRQKDWALQSTANEVQGNQDAVAESAGQNRWALQ